jgi:hypothetical protein
MFTLIYLVSCDLETDYSRVSGRLPSVNSTFIPYLMGIFVNTQISSLILKSLAGGSRDSVSHFPHLIYSWNISFYDFIWSSLSHLWHRHNRGLRYLLVAYFQWFAKRLLRFLSLINLFYTKPRAISGIFQSLLKRHR